MAVVVVVLPWLLGGTGTDGMGRDVGVERGHRLGMHLVYAKTENYWGVRCSVVPIQI
jgi:hypothetical protein